MIQYRTAILASNAPMDYRTLNWIYFLDPPRGLGGQGPSCQERLGVLIIPRRGICGRSFQ